MSVVTTLARIAEIETALAPQQPAPERTEAAGGTNFARILGQTALTSPNSTGGGLGALTAARGEIGQAEQPPGSNDSTRIAEYRTKTQGAGVGPWCAYFVSWAAAEAGVPLGERGEGFGSVDALYEWAESSGRAVPAGDGRPAPGDLIVWDEHIGIVEAVLPDGSIRTVEGNSSDQVSQRTYGPDGGGAIGYVRLG